LVAAIFGCTGPVLIIVNSAMAAGYTNEQTISWLFSVYFLGGILSFVLALRYKQPITGAWSIPAAVMLGSTLVYFDIHQAAGAYFLAGVLVLVLGLTGIIGKVMRWIPLPIVMGMIAGAMIRFGTGIVTSIQVLPIIGFSALVGYLVFYRISRKLPSILGALVFGFAAAALTGSLDFSSMSYRFIGPQLIRPDFSLDAFLSITVPLAILVIGAENAQAVGVMMTQGYRPPVNFMTVVSGLGGIAASVFGGHNANIAGPMTAICSSEEAGKDVDGRYAATVVNGILIGSFGLFASVAVGFIKGLPAPLIGIIAGLAMIGVLTQAFEGAFAARKFRVGAFFALVIAMSGITIVKISAPFWALLGGVAISFVIETDDFKK
jgi:benzoate membrane transport protein